MHVPPKNASSSPVGHHSIRQWVLQGPVPKWNKCSQLLIQRWNCILRPVRNMWIPVRHHAIRDHGCVLPGSVPALVRYWLLNVAAGTGIWYRYWVLLTTFIPVSSCYGVQDWFLVGIRQIYIYICGIETCIKQVEGSGIISSTYQITTGIKAGIASALTRLC
jgi:hypothetical protein